MGLYFDFNSISPTTGGGGGSSVNVSALNITPTTSAQSFVANVGEAYSPVNVSAVNASIDPNITAQNIVNGCNILGVIGSASASAPKEVARYQVYDNGVAAANDQDVTGMFNDIVEIRENVFYQGFMYSNITGSASFNMLRTINRNGCNRAFDRTNISSFSMPNVTNIQNDGCRNIANGSKINSSIIFNTSVLVDNRGLMSAFAYTNMPYLEMTISCKGNNCCDSFCQDCKNLTSVNIKVDTNSTIYNSNAAFNFAFAGSTIQNFTIYNFPFQSWSNAFMGAFQYCSNIEEITIKSSTPQYANASMFKSMAGSTNPNLRKIDLSTVSGTADAFIAFDGGMNSIASGAPNLSSVDLSLFEYAGNYSFNNAFSNTPNLVTMSYDSLWYVGQNAFINTHANSGIKTLYFPSMTNMGAYGFTNALYRCQDVVVHFPVTFNNASIMPPFISGFGGTNTTILFDLPGVSSNFTNMYSITESGTLGGANFAVGASSNSANAYLAMNNAGTGWEADTQVAYLDFYFPNAAKLSNIVTTHPSSRYALVKNVQGSNDGSSWSMLAENTDSTDWLGYIVPTNPEYFKYYRVYFTNDRGSVNTPLINTVRFSGFYRP